MGNTDSYFSSSMRSLGPDVEDETLVEMCINPDGTIWIERRGDAFMSRSVTSVSPEVIRTLAEQIAGNANVTISKDRPLVSASVEYKGRPIRAQVVIPPASLNGYAVSMRFFSSIPLDEIKLEYLHGEAFSLDAAREKRNEQLKQVVKGGNLSDALEYCVRQRLNMLISGGTSTGKTVALRKIMQLIPKEERIITIEDAAELLPTQPNSVCLIADRNSKHRSPDDLLLSTLRMRPDRLVVGEVRGKEAMTFLEAINTGHGGSITTLHADTPRLAMDRLAMAAGRSDVPMNYSEVKEYIRRSIDVVIQTGREEGRRGITEFYLPVTEEL